MSGFIGFFLAIAILIVVHEWGHYIVARLCGVSVLAFSLGFGSVLFRYTDKRGCEWRLSSIPLGGYVKMLSFEEKESLEKDYPGRQFDWAHAFENADVKKRLLIVLAGPVMNLVFAAVLYAGLAMYGGQEIAPKVGLPAVGSQAERQGVEDGWTIKRIGEDSIETFSQAHRLLSGLAPKERISVQFESASGASRWVDFYAEESSEETKGKTAMFGLVPHIESILVGRVEKDSAAEAAGLKSGDAILRLNGRAVADAQSVIDVIRASASKPIQLRIREAESGQERELSIRPKLTKLDSGEEVLRIGATLASIPSTVFVRHNPAEAMWMGVRQVYGFASMTAGGIWRMIEGKESLKSVGGPVTIGTLAGKTLQIGAYAFISFLALLSVSLGILNLLPVPLLDGGHAVLYVWELITGMRPTKMVSAILTRIGIAFVLCLMGLAIFNDVVGFFQLD